MTDFDTDALPKRQLPLWRRLLDGLRHGFEAAVTGVMLALIQLYRWILSPFIGGQCRFYPTCSIYAREAIKLHGPWRGCVLAAKRLGCCHPLHPGGNDPVPPK